VTKYIPFDGIAHAGGQYALDHYRALERFAELIVVAPSTPLNRDAVRRPGAPRTVHLIEGTGLTRGGRAKLLSDLGSVIGGSTAPRAMTRGMGTTAWPWAEFDRADIVEFQWSEMASVAGRVRERYPKKPLVLVAHDVITQRWLRSAEMARNPLVRFAFAAAANRSRERERRDFTIANVVEVFSTKDADLVRELAPGASPVVVAPGFGPGSISEAQVASDSKTVLFTGALSRPDNERGVLWFLRHVWPQVLARVPDAEFVVAGAGARRSLTAAVQGADRASLTGYVPSLEPLYGSARVFVVPVLTGAGVKFKTIDALVRGIPTVSTSVGAEGIDNPEAFAGVTDDPIVFADRVAEALAGGHDARASDAQRWASGTYGSDAFAQRLRHLYESVLHKRLA
jgi:glycosyltransferase involved in cell wall biosynthesis